MSRRPLAVMTTLLAGALILVPVVVPLLVWASVQDDAQWWLPSTAPAASSAVAGG